MRLTPVTSLRQSQDPRADAIELAHLSASTIPSSEIGILRWKGVPIDNILSYTAEKYEKAIRDDLAIPAISAEGIDGLGGGVDRTEHLVVRDLDLPQVEPSSPPSDQGRIIAHVEYAYCPPDWFTRNTHIKHPSTPIDPRIREGNQKLMDHFTSEIYRISEDQTGGRECYMVMALHTLDTHLRKGIASILVQWIFPYARTTGRPLFLVASPVGAHVYWKNGYESVGGDEGVIEIPLEPWGGDEGVVHRLIAMRNAEGVSETGIKPRDGT